MQQVHNHENMNQISLVTQTFFSSCVGFLYLFVFHFCCGFCCGVCIQEQKLFNKKQLEKGQTQIRQLQHT